MSDRDRKPTDADATTDAAEAAAREAAARAPGARRARLERQLHAALDKLEAARPLAKALHQGEVCTVALRLLKEPGGIETLHAEAPRFDRAGVFHGGDWDRPAALDPTLVVRALRAGGVALALDALSHLRLLALAEERCTHAEATAADARAFLEAMLAHNIDVLFPEATEESRRQADLQAGPLARAVTRLWRFVADRLGYEGILGAMLAEIELQLHERPIAVDRTKEMIRLAAHSPAAEGAAEVHRRARELLGAVEGPTELCRSTNTETAYAEALEELGADALASEAGALGRSMGATGLVCPQHGALVRFAAARADTGLLARALGLGPTGRASLDAHASLVRELVGVAVHRATAQCVYGLACLLESGGLFFRPLAPELLRLAHLPLHPAVAQTLLDSAPREPDLSANALLLAGTLSVLGQPLGLGQGDNPTCQAARAISLWASVDAGYLLECLAQTARDDRLVMHFEGRAIASDEVGPGIVHELHTELDAVSLVLVPHLDRIYAEMSRRVVGRGEDGHRWINPEFHGWWVDRGFATAIEFATGAVTGFADFVRLFYATYHPDYRGRAELTYPQPAGIAATDGRGTRLGWHAISIQRVTADPQGEVRVYFFNPNNRSRQRWGQGIETSTSGHGEAHGESSLPFHEFAARLYLFHYNEREHGPPEAAPADEVRRIEALARESWARDLAWTG